MLTLDQRRTLEWMLRTRETEVAVGAVLVKLDGEGYSHVVVHPDGSYQTVRLGELHPPPKLRPEEVP